MASAFLTAAIDGGTASVIGAILVFVAAIAQQVFRKTKPEAAVDKSTARLNDAQAWSEMLEHQKDLAEQYRRDSEMYLAEARTLRAELAEEREEREREREVYDQRIDALQQRLDRQDDEIKRLRILIDRT